MRWQRHAKARWSRRCVRRQGRAGSTAMLPFACANWSERRQLIRAFSKTFCRRPRSRMSSRRSRRVMPGSSCLRNRGGRAFPIAERVLMTALLVGLGLGVGGAFLIEMLNHGFTTPRQVEDLLGVPVLASIHQMEDGKLKKRGTIASGSTLPNRASTLAFQRSNADAAKWHPHVGRGSAAEGHSRHLGPPR